MLGAHAGDYTIAYVVPYQYMTRKIGAHVSAAGGLDKAIERAHAIGANCLQLFSGSPRVWKRSPLESFAVEKMFSKQKELLVEPIFTHSLYLVNLASENPELIAKSAQALSFDLQFDALIKGSGIIVHLGSHQKRGWLAVREQVARVITEILSTAPNNATFLIENSAGQSGKLCSDFAEIRWLLDQVQSPQLGWCLDTCHAHASGLRLDTTALEQITALKLWDSLRCIHVNDSKDPHASGRDRHENLLAGTIPQAELTAFLHAPELAHIPLILEVPGLDGMGPDAANITTLQELCQV